MALIFELAKVTFASIMSKSSYEAIYGTFAAFPLFLVWIWVSWTIVLIGAELVKSLGVYRFGGNQSIEAAFFQVILVLELFFLAHQKGEVVTETDIRKFGHRINLEEWTEMRSKLMDLNLIRIVEKGGLVLSRDLNEVSIWDLYEQLDLPLPQQVKGDKSWEKKLSGRFSDLYEGSKSALREDLEGLFKEV